MLDATHHFYVDGTAVEPKSDINILRRRMFSKFALEAKAGQTVVLEKFSNVFTSRDKELKGCTKQQIQTHALAQLREDERAGFNALLAESAACWLDKVWMRVPIAIDGPDFDQLAIRFAQYHMQLMTPAHDNRMNIGAKGLSGEGYKGHTFWDTEIFLLPYFIFNMPEMARSLEPGDDGKLHINDVVGPDEYNEHVDDNAFTNYLVWWTLDKAIEYSAQLEEEKPELYTKLGLGALRPRWAEQVNQIFLTQPNEDGVLPQDSTYLTLKDIDLTKYKKQAHVGGIYKDYNQEQITKIQVSKQADVMVLSLPAAVWESDGYSPGTVINYPKQRTHFAAPPVSRQAPDGSPLAPAGKGKFSAVIGQIVVRIFFRDIFLAGDRAGAVLGVDVHPLGVPERTISSPAPLIPGVFLRKQAERFCDDANVLSERDDQNLRRPRQKRGPMGYG